MHHPNVPRRKRCGITKAFPVWQLENRVYSSDVEFLSEKQFFASSENKRVKIPKQGDWPPMKSIEISENFSVDLPGA